MEQKLVALCVASVMLTGGAELLYGQSKLEDSSPAPCSPDTPEEAIEPIILATEDNEVARLTNLGLQDALLGYDTRARAYYNRALNIEPNNALALCGLMMLEQHSRIDYSQQLKKLTAIVNSPNYMATPQEMFYVETFLKLIAGDIKGAADDFRNRSIKYRADVLSACWSVALLHAAQDDSAMNMAKELFDKYPEHPLCQYIYCQLFQTSSSIPHEISELSLKCTENLNRHPMALHLAAHLHFKNSKIEESVKLLSEERTKLLSDISTRKIDSKDSYEILRAELYLISIQKSYRDSLKLYRTLFSDNILADETVSRNDILYRWEVMTLPMRLLLFRSIPPSADEVRKAIAYNVPHETFIEDDGAYQFGECLKCILQLRVLHKGKRTQKAHELLQKAEYHFAQLRDNRANLSKKSVSYLLCYQRALDCAESAITLGRFLLYKDSSSMWNNKVNSAIMNQLQPRMLPPMILRK